MEDKDTLYLTYNAGRGHMTLNLNHFLPCTKAALRRIEKLILEDNDPEARVRDIRQYIDQRDVALDDILEEGAYVLGEQNIRNIRQMQESLRITRKDLMEWAEKTGLIS